MYYSRAEYLYTRERRQGKTVMVAYASNERLGEPAHPQIIAWTYVVYKMLTLGQSICTHVSGAMGKHP